MVKSTRLFMNSGTTLLRMVAGVLISLVLTPFILFKVGIEAYGVYALVTALVSYTSMLDLGIPTALSKYFAEYETTDQKEKMQKAVTTAFATFSFLSIVLAGLAWMLRSILFDTFFPAVENRGELTFLFFGCLFSFLLNIVTSVFPSILQGLQRMDVTSFVSLVSDVVMAIFVLILLSMGSGIGGLVYAVVIGACVAAILNLVFVKRLYPSFALRLRDIRVAELKKLLRFSLQMQSINVASLVHTQFDKILLGATLGVRYVAYYDIAGKIIKHIRNVPTSLIAPMLPAASSLAAANEKEKLQKLYERSLKYMVGISLPLFLIAILLSYPFIKVWLGEGYELSIYTLYFLLVANFINVFAGPAFWMLTGTGRIKYATVTALSFAAVNIVLNIVLVRFFGYTGVVAGTSISFILGALVLLVLYHRLDRIPLVSTVYKTLVIPLVGTIGAVVSFFVIRQLVSQLNMFSLIFTGGILALTYLAIVLGLGFLDAYDKTKMREFVSLFLSYKKTDETGTKRA